MMYDEMLSRSTMPVTTGVMGSINRGLHITYYCEQVHDLPLSQLSSVTRSPAIVVMNSWTYNKSHSLH